MRILMIALLAAFLAAPIAIAGDRPIGPEPGEARTEEGGGGDFVKEPDWETTNPKPGVHAPPNELGLTWWDRIFRNAEFSFRTWC